MTRTITPRRTAVTEALKLAHGYLFNRWQAADATKAQKKIYDAPKADKSELLSYVQTLGEVDETGSYVWRFPDPVMIGTEEITGLKYRRGETPTELDTDAIQAYARENDLEYKLSSAVFQVDGLSSEQLTKITNFIYKQVLAARRQLNDDEVAFVIRQVWDYDKLYVLNQQGLIPDKVLESFLVSHPENAPWSLIVVKD